MSNESRAKFERDLRLFITSKNGPEPTSRVGDLFHTDSSGEYNRPTGWGAWIGWQSRQLEIDSLRAENERLLKEREDYLEHARLIHFPLKDKKPIIDPDCI